MSVYLLCSWLRAQRAPASCTISRQVSKIVLSKLVRLKNLRRSLCVLLCYGVYRCAICDDPTLPLQHATYGGYYYRIYPPTHLPLYYSLGVK